MGEWTLSKEELFLWKTALLNVCGGAQIRLVLSILFVTRLWGTAANAAHSSSGGGLSSVASDTVRVERCNFWRNTVGTVVGLGNLTTTMPLAPQVWNVPNSSDFVPTFHVTEPTSLDPVDWDIRGGGARIELTTQQAVVHLSNFDGNKAMSAGLGGGLYTRNRYYLIDECMFRYVQSIVSTQDRRKRSPRVGSRFNCCSLS